MNKTLSYIFFFYHSENNGNVLTDFSPTAKEKIPQVHPEGKVNG